jgi:hypothetical protein
MGTRDTWKRVQSPCKDHLRLGVPKIIYQLTIMHIQAQPISAEFSHEQQTSAWFGYEFSMCPKDSCTEI